MPRFWEIEYRNLSDVIGKPAYINVDMGYIRDGVVDRTFLIDGDNYCANFSIVAPKIASKFVFFVFF